MLTKQELKAWTDALRSNEYVQGKDFFKKLNEQGDLCFCAIGLLCEVNGITGTKDGDMFTYSSEEDEDFLNRSKLNSEHAYGQFWILSMPDLQGYTSIADANDGGVSFTAIADHLDKYYPAV